MRESVGNRKAITDQVWLGVFDHVVAEKHHHPFSSMTNLTDTSHYSKGMEQQELVHPQHHTHCVHHDCAHCGLCALTTTNTCTVPVGENHHSVLVGWW